jgi:hypothetical protein
MSAALATVDTDRLAKLIRLIFGSNRDGEVVAAVAAVRRILAASDLDAHWLADRVAAPTALATVDDDRDDRDCRSDAWFCFHRRHMLSPKERAFIENIIQWSSPLSPKQRQWLHDIVDRLETA